MKKTMILGLLAILITLTASAQSGMKQFYAQHRADNDVTQIKVPRLLLAFAKHDREARAVLKHLKSLKVFQMERTVATRPSIAKELENALNSDGFESVLQVSESGEHVNIYIAQDEKFIRKVLIAVDSDDELVLVQANTKLSFDRLNELLLDSYRKGKGVRLKS